MSSAEYTLAVSPQARPRYHPHAMSAHATLTDELIAFLQGGRLLALASCDAFLSPTIAPALACLVDEDKRTLTVLLSRKQAGRLLADIAGNPHIALLASQPGQPQKLQLKGRDAQEVTLPANAQACIEAQREAIAAELLPLGFGTRYSYALCDDQQDLDGIRFTLAELIRPLAGMLQRSAA